MPTELREDFLSGVRSGVNGTPTFFVNGIRRDGGCDAEALLEALRERALDVARSKDSSRGDLLEPLPRREELEALMRRYHHLKNGARRRPSKARRGMRIEERLLDVRERFDRLSRSGFPRRSSGARGGSICTTARPCRPGRLRFDRSSSTA